MTDISCGLRARLLLEKQGFRAAHSLGQNFLFDEGLLEKLIDLAGVEQGDEVLEIGPGAGIMTALLARRAGRVVAVEIDRALLPVLQGMLEGVDNARVVFADVRKVALEELVQPGARVVANLPYYVTAEAIERLLLSRLRLKSVALMLQKEAAQRLMSAPGDKNWCALAAMTQYFGRPRIMCEVPPEAFEPAPHVQSAFLRIDLYAQKPVQPADEAVFLRVIAAAFAMRRKTLQNNLRAAFSLKAEEAAALLEAAGIPARARGETLTLGELARLSDAIKTAKNEFL